QDIKIDLPDERDQLETRSSARFAELRHHVYEQIQLAKQGFRPDEAKAQVYTHVIRTHRENRNLWVLRGAFLFFRYPEVDCGRPANGVLRRTERPADALVEPLKFSPQ